MSPPLLVLIVLALSPGEEAASSGPPPSARASAQTREIRASNAELALTEGRPEEALSLWRALLAEAPRDDRALVWQDGVVRALWAMNQVDEACAETDRMVGAMESDPPRAGPGGHRAQAAAEARELLEARLSERATRLHEASLGPQIDGGSRRQRPPPEERARLQERSRAAYIAWFEAFPTSTLAGERHYAYGELLYGMKRYDEAYEQYLAYLQVEPAGSHAEFCAQSAVFAAEEVIRAQDRARPRDLGLSGSVEEIPLDLWDERLIEASDRYAAQYTGLQAISFRYQAAYLLYSRFHFDEAEPRFRQIIASDPARREAQMAADMILDMYALKEDWLSLRSASKVWCEDQRFGDDGFRAEACRIYEGASFKQAAHEADADPARGVEEYRRFIAEFPESEWLGGALPGLVGCLARLGDEAGVAREAAPLEAQAAALRAGQPEKAAKIYRKLLAAAPGSSQAARWRALAEEAEQAR